LVAGCIRLALKHPDDLVQHIWKSKNGKTTFYIYNNLYTQSNYTEIILHMKEDAIEICNKVKISELATYYSEFLTYLIHIMNTITK